MKFAFNAAVKLILMALAVSSAFAQSDYYK